MTAQEQQLLFERTKARIEGAVRVFSDLARTSLDPSAFFPRFVETAVDCLSAQGAALWLERPGQQFEKVAGHNFESILHQQNERQRNSIETVLRQTLQQKKSCIVAAGEPGSIYPAPIEGEIINLTAFPIFYLPVFAGDRVAAILQVWLREAGDPKTYSDILAFLANLGSQASQFFQNYTTALQSRQNEELQLLLRMQSSLLGQLDPKEVALILANYTSDLLHADLACVFRRSGKKFKLFTASNQEVVDVRSHQVVALTALVNSLPAFPEDGTLLLSAQTSPDNTENTEDSEDLSILFQAAGVQHLIARAVFPIQPGSSHSPHRDFLLLAFRNESLPFAPNAKNTAARLTEAAGRSLDAAHHHHHLPIRPLLSGVSKARQAILAGRGRPIFLWTALFVGLVLAAFLVPYPLRITAECEVRPALLTQAVAHAQGKIKEVLVREGEPVEAGQVLARLEDTDYQTQLAILAQQQQRWQIEAARAQTMGNEAERKLAQINAQREAEAYRRIEYLRDRTLIRAPKPGIVTSKNLANREGQFLEIGQTFAEVADRDQFEVVLRIKQADIGQLLRALQEQGELPVRFVLHSHATQSVRTTLHNSIEISQLPQIYHGQSYYLAVLTFPADSPLREVLKPGYTGKAKIRLGTSNFAYALTRPFINFIRVEFQWF
jgi:multidrug efflux pump subunit AcrA (membrane-fusion protein)